MIITHNMEALNADRNLGITNRALSKSTEKLSSGYRINRAADDTAGLAISEEMRGQIRGLNRGAQNTEEGILFCNVADAGMHEIEDMVHRIRELCVQGANDTNVKEDRIAIQNEIDVLVNEIDRITEDTEYNTIKVFRPNVIESTYDVELTTGVWKLIKQIVYEQPSGNKYGIANILGDKHIYDGTRLSHQLDFSGGGWNTTGKDIAYSGVGLGSGKNWSDTAAYLQNTYGVNVPQHSPGGTSANFVSSDGMSEVKVTYDRYDTTGERYVTKISIETYDKNVTDSNKKLLSTKVIGSDAGNGKKGYSSTGKFNSTWLDFSGVGTDYAIDSLDGQGFNSSCGHCSKPYSITLLATSASASAVKLTTNADGVKYNFNGSTSTPNLSVDISNCTSGADIVKNIMSAVQSESYMTGHLTQYAYNDSDPGKLYIYDNCSSTPITENSYFGHWEPQARNETGGTIGHVVYTKVWVPDKSRVTEYKHGELNIQVGANSMQLVGIDKPWLTASILGLIGVGPAPSESDESFQRATESIAVCDRALDILNAKRSYIGAVTNRLAHAYDNDKNEAENTQSAESLLRDADIADEMVRFSAANIILQAGQSMLAQANQSRNGITTLLQG